MKLWTVFGILLGVCWLLYGNSLHNPFMADDHAIFSDVKVKNLKFLPNAFYASHQLNQSDDFIDSNLYYRPMAYVFASFSYALFGAHPFGYHVLNLILFSIMCLMVYVFVDFFFANKGLGFLVAILFAVHPINVFFVNYITSGIHSIRFILMFLSLMFFLKALQHRSHGVILYVFSLLCFCVALLCHETSIVLPLYVVFTAYFFKNTGFKQACLKSWPYWLVLALYVLFRFQFTNVFGTSDDSTAHFHLNSVVYLATFSKIIFLYVSKLLVPQGIVFLWNSPLVKHFLFVWIGGFALLLVGYWLLWERNQKGIAFFSATWLLLGFVPVTMACVTSLHLGLIIEPQWLTFSSVGFFVFTAALMLKLYNRYKFLFYLSLIIVVSAWVFNVRHLNWIWGNEERYYAFWCEQIEPHGQVNDFTYANILFGEKKYAQARYYYLKAFKVKPDARIYDNLGIIDLDQGFPVRAQREFVAALTYDPTDSSALNNLGTVFLQKKDYSSAKRFFMRALAADQYSIEARLNLASVSLEEANDARAAILYRQNLGIDHYEPRSLLGLVKIAVQSNDVPYAEKYSHWLIRHNTDAGTLTGLGSFLAEHHFFVLASQAFQKAMHVDPQYAEVYIEAGKLLANLNQYDKAVLVWREGQKIVPTDGKFRKYIDKALALKAK